MNGLVAKIDEQGPFAWIGLMVVSFIIFWPAGVALLAYLIWSGRMGCRAGRWGHRSMSRWHDAWHDKKKRWKAQPTSGNAAFDEYREETIQRLEEEEREFHEFLGRLRQAKDRREFDDFMADRRRRREEASEAASAGDDAPQGSSQGPSQGPSGGSDFRDYRGPEASGNPA